MSAPTAPRITGDEDSTGEWPAGRRSLVFRLVERLAARAKHDPGYRIESELSDRDLVDELGRRGSEALRGLLLRRKLQSVDGLLFAGRGITVRHGRRIRIGASGNVGEGVLLDALGREGIVLGRNVTIARGAALVCTGVLARPGVGIKIGDRSGVGDHSFLGGQGGLTIGSDVLFGPGVRVFTENHVFDRSDVPIREQGERRAPVVIEDDCWIGAGATILGGVRIGRGSVIGAGAVVTRDVPPDSVAHGVPARVVGSRYSTPTPE